MIQEISIEYCECPKCKPTNWKCCSVCGMLYKNFNPHNCNSMIIWSGEYYNESKTQCVRNDIKKILIKDRIKKILRNAWMIGEPTFRCFDYYGTRMDAFINDLQSGKLDDVKKHLKYCGRCQYIYNKVLSCTLP